MGKSVVAVKRGVVLACALVALGLVGLTPAALAATSQSGTTEVMFNIAPALEVVMWPGANLTLIDTPPGVASVSSQMRIAVKSNTSWGVQITSDSANGKMREYDMSTGKYVVDGSETGPVEFATDPQGPWTPISSSPTKIFSGQPPTGETGAALGFWIRVTPNFDALELAYGRTYRIVLTYTAGVGY